jgi:hypothetical protein
MATDNRDRLNYGVVLSDGSRPVFDGDRCIGKLMPQLKDSRQQPKSLAHRMIEARQ